MCKIGAVLALVGVLLWWWRCSGGGDGDFVVSGTGPLLAAVSLVNPEGTGRRQCVATLLTSARYTETLFPIWLEAVRGPGGFAGPVYVIARAGVMLAPPDSVTVLTVKEEAHDQFLKHHMWSLPCSKVVYLDVDVYSQAPLRRIFDVCTAPICASLDLQNNAGRQSGYFNCGVLALTPNKSVADVMRALFARNSPPPRFAEQDILNAALADSDVVQILPRTYNFLHGSTDERALAAINHCTFDQDKQQCMQTAAASTLHAWRARHAKVRHDNATMVCLGPRAPRRAVTVIGLWDLGARTAGDGRGLQDYLAWLGKTLMLDAAYVVFAGQAVAEWVLSSFADREICVVPMELTRHPYYGMWHDRNAKVLPAFRKRVEAPSRVENVNSEYNIIQWGKVMLMRLAIEVYDPYESQYVQWIDAGGSRFFPPGAAGAAFPEGGLADRPAGFTILAWSPNLKAQCSNQLALQGAVQYVVGGAMGCPASEIARFEGIWRDEIGQALALETAPNDQILMHMLWCKMPFLFEVAVVPARGKHEFGHLFDGFFGVARMQRVRPQRGGCTNADFEQTHPAAVFTLATVGYNYMLGVETLGLSLVEHAPPGADLVYLELAERPVHPRWRARLGRAGWKRCTVPAVMPTNVRGTYGRFIHQFTKLRLFGMTNYERIVYLDADMLAVGSIAPLFELPMHGWKIAAARDFWFTDWADGFNMGMFVVEPDKAEYHRLLRLHLSNAVAYDANSAEQAFLNEVYKDQWLRVEHRFNANTAVYDAARSYWDAHPAAVIHFTLKKPWECAGTTFRQLCSLWDSRRRASFACRGVTCVVTRLLTTDRV